MTLMSYFLIVVELALHLLWRVLPSAVIEGKLEHVSKVSGHVYRHITAEPMYYLGRRRRR